jgi:hypothetical protein
MHRCVDHFKHLAQRFESLLKRIRGEDYFEEISTLHHYISDFVKRCFIENDVSTDFPPPRTPPKKI